MKKKTTFFLGMLLLIGMSSFSVHKFYVSIYQVDFIPEKKRVEITARIFTDDLNLALEAAFKTKSNLGEKSETKKDVAFLQSYLASHLHIFIDGKEKPILFLSKEIENNVVVVYLKINDVKKFNTIKITNNALLDLYPDQQNIMQTRFYNKKRNYIFTGDYFVENIQMK
jgi:hypothetical protein